MKPIILLLLVLQAGCASLDNAGVASYSVKPFITADGAAHCCEIVVRNGKEIATLEAHIAKRGDDYTVDLTEHGVQAFAGQAIAAGASQAALDSAVKAAMAAALAPFLPALIPAAGAALSSPGIGAALTGAAAGVGASSILSSEAKP